MGQCLNITKKTEYAIAALSRLALMSNFGKGSAIPVEAIAQSQKIPRSFLSKIMAGCVRAGLIRAKKGPLGGVTLAKPASQMTLMEIIEACEGSYHRDFCLFYPERVCEGLNCPIYCPLRKEEEITRSKLGRLSLEQMARALAKHPNFKESIARPPAATEKATEAIKAKKATKGKE